MKYEFVKIDDDTTELRYKDKKYEFKKTVGLIEKLQKIHYQAKIDMMVNLKEKGLTANDLIVTTKKDGKIIEDKSNLVELENYFRGIESEVIYADICKQFTGKGFANLLVDVGIDTNNAEEIKDFTMKLSAAIMSQDNTPSDEVL